MMSRQYGKSVLLQMAAEAGIPVREVGEIDFKGHALQWVILDEFDGRKLSEQNNRVCDVARCANVTLVIDGEQVGKIIADLMINGDPTVEAPGGTGIVELFVKKHVTAMVALEDNKRNRQRGPRKREGKWVPRHERWS